MEQTTPRRAIRARARLCRAGLVVIGLAAAGQAAAQNPGAESRDQRIDEITITGKLSRTERPETPRPIVETTRSFSVIPSERFFDRGQLKLDDTLSYSAGVNADTFGLSTRGDFPQVRGLDVPEYRDGLQSAFGFFNTTQTEIYTLEQVEVLRGPASVVFGAGSPGGLLNTVTKRPRAERGGELVVDGGSFDRLQIAGDVHGSVPGTGGVLEGRLVTVYRDSDTQVEFVGDDAVAVTPSLSFVPGEDTRLTLIGEFVDQNSDTAQQFLPLTGTLEPSASGETIEPGTFLGDPGFNRFNTRATSVTLVGEHRINGMFSLDGTFRYRSSRVDYNQAWVSFRGAGIPRVDAEGNGSRSFFQSDRSAEEVGFDLRGRAQFSTGRLEHNVLLGVNYQDAEFDDDTRFLVSGTINVFEPSFGGVPEVLLDGTPPPDTPGSSTEDLGVYLSNEITAGRLTVNGGFRFDTVDTDNGATTQNEEVWSGSAGLRYDLAYGVAPYFSYAESFEPVVGVDNLTGESLDPQEGRQLEAGLKYQPDNFPVGTSLAFFDIEQSNLPNPEGLPNASSQQEGVAEIRGVELAGEAVIRDFLVTASFTELDTERPDGKPLDSVPGRQASMWLQYQPASGPVDGFKAGLGFRHAEGNVSNGTNPLTGEPVRIETASYTVGDAMVGYESQAWNVTVTLRNFTDRQYFATCLARGDCFPAEERNVVARLAMRF